MLRCPACDGRLPKRSAATTFTASRRVERYWCATCRQFQKGSIQRDFNLEDEGVDYMGPVLWDLGANLPEGHPFAAKSARSERSEDAHTQAA